MNKGVRLKTAVLFGLLGMANVAAWVILLGLSHRYGFLFPLGVLAYVFGLRHAADADHIAAIDNTTRKLMNDGQRPFGIGLFFSLGHSTIVFLLATGLALATHTVKVGLPQLSAVGGILGTSISAAFLYLIALVNLVVLRDIHQAFREIRGTNLTRERILELEEALLRRGLMNRLLGRAYRSIRSSWQMYPVGVLFGLGFDTASEVTLLGLSAFAAGRSLPVAAVLVLPLMFATGMSLVDTLDGVLMQYAYGWAFLNPVRKVFYNLSITAVSVLIALGIGSIEWLQVIGNELAFKGSFWGFLQTLNFSTMGYFVIALLLVSWGAAVVIYRLKGYEKPVVGEELG